MTTSCLHERLVSLDARRAQCISCKHVIEAGDGLCPKCHRALDDSPHRLAQACK